MIFASSSIAPLSMWVLPDVADAVVALEEKFPIRMYVGNRVVWREGRYDLEASAFVVRQSAQSAICGIPDGYGMFVLDERELCVLRPASAGKAAFPLYETGYDAVSRLFELLGVGGEIVVAPAGCVSESICRIPSFDSTAELLLKLAASG